MTGPNKGLTMVPCEQCGVEIAWDDSPNPLCMDCVTVKGYKDEIARLKAALEELQYAQKCPRCGERQTNELCDAEECSGGLPHRACPGWSGMCCDGGHAYAMGQLP